jgi:hypothetical protein
MAGLAYLSLNWFLNRRIERIKAAMPGATLEERAEAAVAEGNSGKIALGGFVTLAAAATGAIWLFVVLFAWLLEWASVLSPDRGRICAFAIQVCGARPARPLAFSSLDTRGNECGCRRPRICKRATTSSPAFGRF